MFVLNDFKKCCFDVSFLTSIGLSTVILRLEKLNFSNKLISKTLIINTFFREGGTE